MTNDTADDTHQPDADDASPPDEHLKRVREHLQQATETADRPIDTQLNSITAGVFDEQTGADNQPDAEPKADRIAEIAAKLDGLAEEASGETVGQIRTARDHCREFLAEGGADEQPGSG